jgi:hypothetical protein
MTVEEVLRQSGFTADQIAALEPRAITAFTGVLTTAQQEREGAEMERRANVDFYEGQIAPSLANWEEEKQRLDNERARIAAEAAFYKTQAEEAKKSGFIAADAPTFNQGRDQNGRYVAGAPGATPGSPTFFDVNKVYEKAGEAVGAITDVDYRYKQLFDGRPMPILPSELVKQADARHVSPMTYAEQVFNFKQREQELQQERQKQHDDKIKQDAVAERDKYWAERRGSNPDVYQPHENAKMTEIARAAKTDPNLDPLSMNDQQRRAHTAQMIRRELAEQQ